MNSNQRSHLTFFIIKTLSIITKMTTLESETFQLAFMSIKFSSIICTSITVQLLRCPDQHYIPMSIQSFPCKPPMLRPLFICGLAAPVFLNKVSFFYSLTLGSMLVTTHALGVLSSYFYRGAEQLRKVKENFYVSQYGVSRWLTFYWQYVSFLMHTKPILTIVPQHKGTITVLVNLSSLYIALV